MVSDPEILRDMVVTKNTEIDRPDTILGLFYNMLGRSFLVMPTDDEWRAKRKGLAHAFFKDRLIVMMEKLKEYSNESHQKWLKEIRASSDGTTKIDISVEIAKIMQNFLMHIIFGRNVNDIKVKVEIKEAGEPIKMVEMNLSDANERLANQ